MSNYAKSFKEQLSQIADLARRKQQLEGQIDKLKNLAMATYELMDEHEKAKYSEASEEINRSEQSLTYEIRQALILEGGEYLTPSQIRDRLRQAGYNFSRYSSNPLVSVHSTLNRLKNELEIVILEDGTKAYRLRRNSRTNDSE